jgi:hypothetical protein
MTTPSNPERLTFEDYLGRAFVYAVGTAIVIATASVASFLALFVISKAHCEFRPESQRCIAIEARAAAREARGVNSGLYP